MLPSDSASFTLSIRQANKSYHGIPALIEAHLDLHSGEVHGLIGENGAGKSTLIKLLAGVLAPDSIQIFFNDTPVSLHNATDSYQLGLRFIHQEVNIVPHLSVAENIFLSHPYPRKAGIFVDWGKLNQLAANVLQQLGVTHIDVTRLAARLSSGDIMLIKIASAFIGDDFSHLRDSGGIIYVMDEPTAALSGEDASMLFSVIQSLKDQGCAVLYVTHRLDELFEIAQRVTVMRDGQVVATHDIESTSTQALIREMTGREMQQIYPPREAPPSDKVVLVVNELTTPYVSDVSFRLNEGEILGIAGLNGSGRSELLRGLVGADPILTGHVRLDGQPLEHLNPTAAWDAGIAYVPEERRTQGLILSDSVNDNMILPHLEAFSTGSIFLNRPYEHRTSGQLGESVQLKAVSTRQHVKQLSGGNQQKVVFARAMAQTPRIILLDEPTRGVDVGAKFDIYRLIRRLSAQGVSIIMVSSELNELIGLCDRMLVMRDQRVVDIVSAQHMTEATLLTLCYGDLEKA